MTTSESNSPTSSTPTSVPSEVTVVFSQRGGHGTLVCKLPHTGHKVTEYLKAGALRGRGLITRAHRGKILNKDGKRVKMTYVPFPGDIILLEW